MLSAVSRIKTNTCNFLSSENFQRKRKKNRKFSLCLNPASVRVLGKSNTRWKTLVSLRDKKNNVAEAELRKAGLVTGLRRAFACDFRAGCSRKTSSKKRFFTVPSTTPNKPANSPVIGASSRTGSAGSGNVERCCGKFEISRKSD